MTSIYINKKNKPPPPKKKSHKLTKKNVQTYKWIKFVCFIIL